MDRGFCGTNREVLGLVGSVGYKLGDEKDGVEKDLTRYRRGFTCS